MDRTGIGYVSHRYPQKTDALFEKHRDEAFGFVAAKYPLFVTSSCVQPDTAHVVVPIIIR